MRSAWTEMVLRRDVVVPQLLGRGVARIPSVSRSDKRALCCAAALNSFGSRDASCAAAPRWNRGHPALLATRLRASQTCTRLLLPSQTTPPQYRHRNCPICRATRCLRIGIQKHRHRLLLARANEYLFVFCPEEICTVASLVRQRNMDVPPSVKLKVAMWTEVTVTA